MNDPLSLSNVGDLILLLIGLGAAAISVVYLLLWWIERPSRGGD